MYGREVGRNCLEDNPKSIIHGRKKHRVIRKPERLSRSAEFPVLLSGADAKRVGRSCRWCYSVGGQGGKGRIAPAGCEITLILTASFVSAFLLPFSMVNACFLHHCTRQYLTTRHWLACVSKLLLYCCRKIIVDSRFDFNNRFSNNFNFKFRNISSKCRINCR